MRDAINVGSERSYRPVHSRRFRVPARSFTFPIFFRFLYGPPILPIFLSALAFNVVAMSYCDRFFFLQHIRSPAFLYLNSSVVLPSSTSRPAPVRLSDAQKLDTRRPKLDTCRPKLDARHLMLERSSERYRLGSKGRTCTANRRVEQERDSKGKARGRVSRRSSALDNRHLIVKCSRHYLFLADYFHYHLLHYNLFLYLYDNEYII